MVEVHGGYSGDYQVSEAVITPYLLTYPNRRTRDAVVQRGLYSIPQHQLQFRVHEWGPRFGMAHDPPTHQVWVKVIGLPLQEWTVPEVTRVLQAFGHPIQILLFGRDVGHYRDITALIETEDPSRIPLAYVYREGDYSIQIDILILSWRQWDGSYFPPPGNPFQDASPSQPLPNHLDNYLTPNRHSSSSSSSPNNAPSEPSIDYSSWSPRSRRFSETPMSGQCLQDYLLSLQKGALEPPPLSLPLSPPTPQLNHTSLLIRLQHHKHAAATIDQISIPNASHTTPLQFLSLTLVPRPIAITPLFFLFTNLEGNRTWGEASSTVAPLMTDLCYAIAPLLSQPKKRAINTLLLDMTTDEPPIDYMPQNQAHLSPGQSPTQAKR